jgi:hypothetical protein
MFLFGAGIYCGSFMLGTNFTYRLMFLLLCMPQLQDWQIRRDEGDTAVGIAELGLFGTVLGVLWLNGNANGHSIFLLLPQLLDWFLFFCMAALLMLNFLRTSAVSALTHRGCGVLTPVRWSLAGHFRDRCFSTSQPPSCVGMRTDKIARKRVLCSNRFADCKLSIHAGVEHLGDSAWRSARLMCEDHLDTDTSEARNAVAALSSMRCSLKNSPINGISGQMKRVLDF